VTVLGAVGKPGIYPMTTALTASQALFMAGGATKTAYLPHTRIVRGNPQHPTIIPADIDLVIEQGLMSAEKRLQAGDVLYVPNTRIADWNALIADVRPTIQLASEPFRFYYFFRIFRLND
jgi:protein involved in polysaccharide export with SLBB domain